MTPRFQRSHWKPRGVLGAFLLALAVLGCGLSLPGQDPGQADGSADPRPNARMPLLVGRPLGTAQKIVAGAREEVRRGVTYDASYVKMPYPGGDVPADRGACTDVLVRALRYAGHDLQKLIHEDMRRHFRLYPTRYGLRRPDPNIDHRRTPNHMVFLRRRGRSLPLATSGAAAATWKAGDLVYWRLPNGMGHCGVVSDRNRADGLPLVIHNIGGAAEEDVLTAWEITGHSRYPAEAATRAGTLDPS